ncbi:unnamed protein product [Meganyctiphanes norvegica]|uniref:Major facilitator superfamily (MFS) profile domain-containing protein n=1 Tax=Meganyctiphanes norvegica TaxID=48144 RepID=A0AAV2S5Q2_MEGNR
MSDANADIFSSIPFGKWNWLYISIVCLQKASAPAQYYSSIFVDMPIDFRCISNETRQDNITFDNSCPENKESLHNCTTYEFDTSEVSSTFTSTFNLVCDKAWVASMYPMILPIGSCFGSFFLGASDKWGRVTVIRISSTIHAVGALIVGLARYEYLVIFGRFLVGFTYPILSGSAIPLSIETTPVKDRSTITFLLFIPFYVFVMLLGIMAYFIREWRMLYLVTSIPMFIIPIIALFLDKSPRWLIQQGRVDEAYIVMQKAAKMNNGTFDFDLSSIEKESSSQSNEQNFNANFVNSSIESVKTLIKQLYGTISMLKLSFIIPILWFLSAIVYIGVPLNANSFTDNPYLYMVMIGAAEFPSAFLGPLIINKFGNIKTGISLFLITSGCMLGTLLVTENFWWMKWIFAMLSMTCSGALIIICNLLISELFPTVLRSTGCGISYSAYYVGFFLSSFINSTIVSEVWWAFNTMCGICCVIASILISLLPETHGQKLCETTNEVDNKEYRYQKVKI